MCEKLLKIKQHLKQNGITQEKAANQLGVSIMAVNVLLNGKREFGKKTLWHGIRHLVTAFRF